MQNKTFSLYEGLFKVKKVIKNRLVNNETIFIFVAGGSASGKTSRVANNIARFNKNDSIVLSMDNYFRGAEYVNANNITFDQPEAINIDLLVEHLEILKNGNEVMIPDYDFVSSISIPNAIKIEPKQVIIVEGLFTLYDVFYKISDLKLFVETSTNGRMIRRVLRDIKRTKQKVNEIVEIFENVVNPMHIKYIEPQKEVSDMIIINEFDSNLEVRYLDIDKFIKDNNIPNLN